MRIQSFRIFRLCLFGVYSVKHCMVNPMVFQKTQPQDKSIRIYTNCGLVFMAIPSQSIIRPTGYYQRAGVYLIYPLKNGNQREKGVNTEQFALMYTQDLCACDKVCIM